MSEEKRNIIFGTGDFADILTGKLEEAGIHVWGYTVNREWVTGSKCNVRPLLAFEELDQHVEPAECSIYIGVIGKHMLQVRESIYYMLRGQGYAMPNFISPRGCVLTKSIGEGNIIMENVVVEAHCRIGHGNILWPNVVLPHHNTVGDFNNLSPSVSFSGYSKIGSRCFIGNNASLNNHVRVADRALVGAGVFVHRDLGEEEVLVAERSYVLSGRKSYEFK